MSRTGRMIFGLFIMSLIVGGPIAYGNFVQSHMRNFRVVREGVLYRSGQMSLKGLQQMVHDRGIKTVVTLRDSYYAGKLPPDWKEEQYCKSQEINYVRIPPPQFRGPRRLGARRRRRPPISCRHGRPAQLSGASPLLRGHPSHGSLLFYLSHGI